MNQFIKTIWLLGLIALLLSCDSVPPTIEPKPDLITHYHRIELTNSHVIYIKASSCSIEYQSEVFDGGASDQLYQM